jgi:hypothetical protein
MAVTLADVDTWNPDLIRDAFHADAAADMHMGLGRIPAFLSWHGEAAAAAQGAIDKTRGDLLLHSDQAAIAAMRAYDAIDMIAQVKKDLKQADNDAKNWGFTINHTTGEVITVDPKNIGAAHWTVHFVNLGARVQKIAVAANAADVELSRAINTADGAEPVVTGDAAGRQQAINESIERSLRETPLPPGVDPNTIRSFLQNASSQFPAPRTNELGIPGYPDATLTSEQARNVYTHGEQQMKALNQRLIDEGLNPETGAKTLSATRNALRTWTRDLMVDRAATARLGATEKNMSWDEVVDKYKGQGLKGDELWNKLIERSMVSRASVNAGLGVDPQAPELPAMPAVPGAAPATVPAPEIPEIPAPEVPAPPVIEGPPIEIPVEIPLPIIGP